MKISLIVSLFISLTSSVFSQITDYSVSSENLKGQVTKISTKTYKYRPLQKSFYESQSISKTFDKKGRYTSQNSEYAILKTIYNSNYVYKEGKLMKVITTIKDKEPSNGSMEEIVNYVYKNNFLVEVQFRGTNPTTISYAYDEAKRLTKELKTGLGGKKYYEKIFSYTDASNFTITTFFFKDNIKNEKGNVNTYKNGRLISTIYSSYKTPSSSSFSYNEMGDKSDYYYNEKLSNQYIYKYDKNNNWIEKIEKRYNSVTKEITYTYHFREITYKNGSTGGTSFNQELVKKYEERQSYLVKPYEKVLTNYDRILINPDYVNEMLVMKTQAARFKVKTDSGNFLTKHVKAVKHTNKLDMIVYHQKSNTTAVVTDFNDELFRKDFWHKAKIISRTSSMFWNINEKGTWFIIDKGSTYKKYAETKLKYSAENPNDVIVYVDDKPTYIMINFRNAVAHQLYELKEIK